MNNVLNLLIHTSVVSSLLILSIFILRLIFKDKINKSLQYALWLIVAVRLLIPFNFQWTFEVKSTFPEIGFVNSILENNADSYEEYNVIANGRKFFDFSEPQVSKDTFHQSYEKDVYQPSINSNIQNYKHIMSSSSSAYLWSLSDILFITWILGIVCILVIFTIRNVFFHKKIMKSMTLYNFSDDSYNKAAEMVSLKRKIPVYLSYSLTSPCIIGIFNPVIVLTENILQDTEAAKFALIHEMIHYKQKHNFFRLLGNILCALYWFNPLVWLSAETAKNDAELSCDSKVLQKISSNQHLNYCLTLLSIASSSNQMVTAMSTGGRKMKKRIDIILKSPQNWAITIIAMIICISLGAASFTNISVKAKNLNKAELSTENKIKENSPEVISLGNIHEVYRFLTFLPNPNDNYKINTIIINNTAKDKNAYCLARSLFITYELSKNNSTADLSDEDVHRINTNALRLFLSIPDLEAIKISYIDKPANSLIRNEKAPITYTYLRSEIEMQYGNLSVTRGDIESLNIIPKIDNTFWQSMGDNNVLLVFGYSEFYSSIGIKESEYNENQKIANKLLSKLGPYSSSWKSDTSTIYSFSPNPVYSDWSNFMIMTDKYGNLECYGINLSNLN